MPHSDLPKHQTVEWLIEQLKEFPPQKPVGFCTDFFQPLKCVLSLYEAGGVITIDIDEPGM